MTNFKTLSNYDLVLDTKNSVKVETKATLAVIDRIREIERRSVHLEMGFSSLHEFCVKELSYSDGAAHRRIHSMWLCKELPEAVEAITAGRLSLTTAASLQVHFKKEKESYPSQADKQNLLEQVQGKSKRECERIFNPERKGTPVHAILDDETMEDLKRLSELWGIPIRDVGTLIKKMANLTRQAADPALKKTREPKQKTAPPEKLEKPIRYTKVANKKIVWLRDGSQCAYIDSVTKRRCASRFGLELDHIIPVSCGGESTSENLRLLCFAHHDLVTKRVFGKKKIESYRHHLAQKTEK